MYFCSFRRLKFRNYNDHSIFWLRSTLKRGQNKAVNATAYFTTILSSNIRVLKQWWQRRQKRNRVRLAKQQLCTCIMLFCTFLRSHCTTSTQKCLISHFVEDGNTKQQLSFSFSWTSIHSFRIQLQKNLPTFNKLNEMEY